MFHKAQDKWTHAHSSFLLFALGIIVELFVWKNLLFLFLILITFWYISGFFCVLNFFNAPPLIGHNMVDKFDAKLLDYEYYHPVKGSKDSLKNLTVDQLYNMIEKDQGKYEQFKNDCVLQEKF